MTSDSVFAIVSVAGATAACATHGDEHTVAMLVRYYALLADAVRPSQGTVIKVMGDGMVITFPPSRAADAVAALRTAQADATKLWQSFDARCRVQVRAGVGPLIRGSFGPPGDERPDVYGDALNQLFKLPAGDLVVTPALRSVVGGERNGQGE